MTEAALLEALRTAMARPECDESAMLCWEIADAVGLSIPQTSRYLREMVRTGKLQVVRRRVADVTGAMRPQPAYRLAA